MSAVIDNQSIVRATEIFKAVAGAAKNLFLYSEVHPRFKHHCRRVAQLTREYSELVDLPCLPYLFKSGRVYLGKVLLANVGVSGKWLAGVLATNGFEGLIIKSDVTPEDVTAFILGIRHRFRRRFYDGECSPPPPSNEDSGKVQLISEGEAHTIPMGEAVPRQSDKELYLPELQMSRSVGYTFLSTYRSILASIKEGRGFDYSYLLKTTEQIGELFSREGSAALPSVSSSYFDDFTFHHSVNVSAISTAVASSVVSDPEKLSRISLAALLHDIGKSFIPAEILHKPGKLTPGEREEMEAHPVLGAKTLLEVEGIDPLCVTVAFGHHLYDGPSAYPKTRRSYELDWLTRMISVVDVYEALTSVRPYKPGISSRVAFEIMLSMPGLNSRTPLVKLLYDCVGPFPVGSVVELNTGERALVVQQNLQYPFEPKVRVMTDRGGDPVDQPTELDLAPCSDSRKQPPWIYRTVVPQAALEDPLTAEWREEPKTILGADVRDDQVLMAREG